MGEEAEVLRKEKVNNMANEKKTESYDTLLDDLVDGLMLISIIAKAMARKVLKLNAPEGGTNE